MNQRERIIDHLIRYGSITLADALGMSPPIYRLSERIREAERMGYVIKHERVEGKTYERYTLIARPANSYAKAEANNQLSLINN